MARFVSDLLLLGLSVGLSAFLLLRKNDGTIEVAIVFSPFALGTLEAVGNTDDDVLSNSCIFCAQFNHP